MPHMFEHIDWQLFHFLRPGMLWLFPPLGICLLLLAVGSAEPRRWKQLIAPTLRPYLFTKGDRRAPLLPLLMLAVAGSLAILGMAGPAWHKTVVPGQRVQAVVLIAMDLSASMNATDIPPTRLERAKMKLGDFLKTKPGAPCGVVAYAGTPHLVIPFTQDAKLIQLQAGALTTNEMPVPGTNTALLLQYVDTLMRPILAPSTILFFTDNINANDAALLTNYTYTSIHRLEILLMSSPGGAVVPGFSQVFSRQDEPVLQTLTNNPKIFLNRLTLDTTDVGAIAARVRAHLIFEKDEKTSDQSWDDMGYLAIAPVGLLLLCWFRKGWAIQWCWLLLLLHSCSVNDRHADWWYTPDYQGQVLYRQKHYRQATDRFEDIPHKGAAAYKAGDYEAAAALFALDTSAAGTYNKGLALARLGRYEDAENAFRSAALLDPALSEKAQRSLQKISTSKMQVDSVIRMTQAATTKLKEDKKNGPLKERKPQAEDQQRSSDTKVKDMPQTGDRLTDQVKTNIHQFQESESMDSTGAANRDHNDAMKHIILRRPPADPGLFLQKRFALQRKRAYASIKPNAEKW